MATRALLTAAWLLLPAALPAYVTSAVLEFLVDDSVAFYLNGSRVLERSRKEPFSYQVLSTADGNLPLELFKDNQENLLAAENFNPGGGQMGLAFRLTAYQSDGDPVRIWSDPEQAKLFYLPGGKDAPAGWEQPGFDDGAWPGGVGIRMVDQYTMQPVLAEPSLAGLFGGGFVPFLTHQSNARGNGDDRNLIRSRFRFPNKASRVQAVVRPEGAAAGQSVQVQLVPGPDLALVPQFNVLAWLPAGLKLTGASTGARYDAKLRRLDWSFSNRDMDVGHVSLHADKVISASGWSGAERVLGPPKDKGDGIDHQNIPRYAFDDGATVAHGSAAWFGLTAPPAGLAAKGAKIQGVIFHVQLRAGARDMNHKVETDQVLFNYSVDGGAGAALPDDVNILRQTNDSYWSVGYHHASEDRDWTWADLARLRVMLKGRPVGNRDRNLAASIRCTVRYYVPGKVAPSFSAQVLETRCAELPLQAGVFRQGAKLVSADPVPLRVNAALCAPTPRPTPVPPPPVLAQVRPQPTPTPAGTDMAAGRLVLGLGCLEASPQPMDYAGCFLSFCLKAPADVTVNVYDARDGKALRSFKAGDFRAGQGQQVFFNGLDAGGRLLPPGSYLVELTAERGAAKEARNMTLQVVKKRARR